MKPFDLEAAKRGESIEMRVFGKNKKLEWIPVHFIGLATSGAHIVQQLDCGPAMIKDLLLVAVAQSLRMAPKKVTVRYRNYVKRDSQGPRVGALNEGIGYVSPEEFEESDRFIEWIHTEWQTAEI